MQNRIAVIKKHRRKLFALFGGVLILIAIGYAIWLIFFAGKSVSTDNAYTAAEVADVTPLVGGPVKESKCGQHAACACR
jgi:membrane fusion protein (multidrug efflux system)